MIDRNYIPGIIRRLRPMMAREMTSTTKDVYDQMINNWERGADATGKRWTPLAPKTVSEKGHADPLIDTGDMIDSAGYETDKKNTRSVIYVDDEKIRYHEFGTERIPARPVLGPAMRVWDDEIDDAVGKAIDRAYLGARATGGGLAAVRGATR